MVNNMMPRIRERLGLDPISDKKALLLCRAFTVMLGIYIIMVALMLAMQKELSLFDTYLMISAVIGMPMGMPILMALWIKRLHWSSYYIIIGCTLIPSTYFVVRSSMYGESWTLQDRLLWIYIFGAIGCLLSLPVWRIASDAYKERVRAFYEKLHTPVDFESEIGVSQDATQYKILGSITLIIGSCILLFLMLDNTLAARLQILALSLSIMSVGGLLLVIGRRAK